MSIISDLITGKITLAQAVARTETWLGQVGNAIEKTVQNDPAVQGAVNTLVADGKVAITVGADWAETALSGGLGQFATEVEGLVGKYIPLIAGAAGGPLSAAAVTAVQALIDVGTSAIKAEATSVIAAQTPTPG